jgi:hypothetical protein
METTYLWRHPIESGVRGALLKRLGRFCSISCIFASGCYLDICLEIETSNPDHIH